MKYQSEILNEIIEGEGHISPNLHYQSECKESFINSIKGSYPKLTDYEGEWLNYYIENIDIGVFPYLALSNITSGVVENAVPIPYKSAILKGRTKWTNANGDVFDTFFNPVTEFIFTNGYLEMDGTLINNSGHFSTQFIDVTNFDGIEIGKDGTYYGKLCFYDSDKNFISWVTKDGTTGIVKVTSIPSNAKYIRYSATTKDIFIKDNGGRNLALPLSLVSVKMPVLKTTGKNLISKWYDGKMIDDNGELIIREDQIGTDFILIGTEGNFVCESLKKGTVRLFNINKQLIGKLSNVNKTFNVPNQVKYITFNYFKEVMPSFLQLEKGTMATSYEPYKSNILTTPADLELRGIGEGSSRVEDELDCLTGKVTERISEVVLDGSENWNINYQGNSDLITFSLNQFPTNIAEHSFNNCKNFLISDSLPIVTDYKNNKGILSHRLGGNHWMVITVNRSDLISEDVVGFKHFLSTNPVTIQYRLAAESVKTVDLTIVNQDGEPSLFKPFEGVNRYETDGQVLQPTLNIEVPVEAITQNLASFIKLEIEGE